jgi:hexosaminidase
MPTSDVVEYMTYPRASALAEAVWTAAPTRDYDGFARRLRTLLQRLDRLDVRYRDPFAQR